MCVYNEETWAKETTKASGNGGMGKLLIVLYLLLTELIVRNFRATIIFRDINYFRHCCNLFDVCILQSK